MFHTLRHVRLAALRSTVPAREIRLEDEVAFYGGSAKKVARLKASLGMERRRVCPPDVTASDLCAYAAQALLGAVPSARDCIDSLIFVTQNPDWQQPATACELQHRLGLGQSCAAFDVNQGCTGYIYGLWIGASLVASGAARHVLVLVGDVHPEGRDVRNRITAPVFGDGGSATLLVRDECAAPMHFGFGTDGSGFETIINPAGGSRIPFIRDHAQNMALVEDVPDPAGIPWRLNDTYMDGGAVFDFTVSVVPEHVREAMAYAGLAQTDIDRLILHQANRQIVETVGVKAGFPVEKAPAESFSKYGNLAAASIPVALCDAYGKDVPGTLLLCGYGIGLAWGSCLCTVNQWDCAPPLEYEADPERPTRQQRIKRWQKILRGEKSRHE